LDKKNIIVYDQFIFFDNKITYQNLYKDCVVIEDIFIDNIYEHQLNNCFICRNVNDYMFYFTDFQDTHIIIQSKKFNYF